MTSTGTGRLYVLAAAVLWGTTGTAQALGPEGAEPLAVGTMRIVVGGLALALFAGMRGGLSLGTLPLRPAAFSAAAMAAYQPFFFAGVARTGVAVGTVVAIGSAPVITGALALALRGERPGLGWMVATGLAVAGSVLLLAGGRSIEVDPGGVLLALGAGASYAAFALASKELLEHGSATQAAAVSFVGAGILLAPLLLVVDLEWLAQLRGAAVAAHLGLVATALAYLLFGRGLGRIRVTSAATLSLAEPLTAAVLGVVVLDERLTPAALLGIGAILAGLLVVTVGRAPSQSSVMS